MQLWRLLRHLQCFGVDGVAGFLRPQSKIQLQRAIVSALGLCAPILWKSCTCDVRHIVCDCCSCRINLLVLIVFLLNKLQRRAVMQPQCRVQRRTRTQGCRTVRARNKERGASCTCCMHRFRHCMQHFRRLGQGVNLIICLLERISRHFEEVKGFVAVCRQESLHSPKTENQYAALEPDIDTGAVGHCMPPSKIRRGILFG